MSMSTATNGPISSDISTITTTTTTTTATTSTKADGGYVNTVNWYDFIGPLIAILLVMILFIACCKCIMEMCSGCKLFRSTGSEQRVTPGSNNSEVNLSISEDLPPSYSTAGVANIDFERNIILETDSERRQRRRRQLVMGMDYGEEKLPTYLEIIEEDRKMKQDDHSSENPAFQDDEGSRTYLKDVVSDETESDLDQISITTESNLPPPPPYRSPTGD